MEGVSDTELAYTAGIIDGEGNIGIYPNTTKNGYPVFRLRVRVNNTNEWIIHWLQEKYAGSIGITSRKENSYRWKDAWWWTVSCRKAGEFLEAIFPYLIIKKPQAELAIKFQHQMSSNRGKNTPYSKEDIALIEAQKILVNEMNKRGP